MKVSVRTVAFAAMGASLAIGGCSTSGFTHRDELVTPVNCATRTFEIYFSEGSANLTPVAQRALEMTASQLAGCEIRSVSVTGLADSSGSAAANLNLSERRAQAVTDAMVSAGWPLPVIDVQAAGNEGARTGAVNSPMHRRTEVVVEAVARR